MTARTKTRKCTRCDGEGQIQMQTVEEDSITFITTSWKCCPACDGLGVEATHSEVHE